MGNLNSLFGPDLIFRLIAIILGLTLHEFGHALMAVLLGDNTPREQGRLSLNPLVHLDVLGFLMILFAPFGWARPVQFDPRRLRIHRGLGIALVSLAGPVMNVILAVTGLSLLRWILFSSASVSITTNFIVQALIWITNVNLALAIFNLIPVPPLDGWKIFRFALPLRRAAWMDTFERVGPFLLVLLLITPIGGIVIQYVIQTVAGWFGLV